MAAFYGDIMRSVAAASTGAAGVGMDECDSVESTPQRVLLSLSEEEATLFDKIRVASAKEAGMLGCIAETVRAGEKTTIEVGAYEAEDVVCLERAMLMGTTNPTFYDSAVDLTTEMMTRLDAVFVRGTDEAKAMKVLNMTLHILEEGLAKKQSAALLSLAYACASPMYDVRKSALSRLQHAVRYATPLYELTAMLLTIGERCGHVGCGWGAVRMASYRKLLSRFTPLRLVEMSTQMKERSGVSMRDVLRLCHPKPTDDEHERAYSYICATQKPVFDEESPVADFTRDIYAITHAETTDDLLGAMESMGTKCRLRWEYIPCGMLNQPAVFMRLLEDMPPGAMLRQLSRAVKLMEKYPYQSEAVLQYVRATLCDADKVQNARLHPIAVQLAAVTLDGQNAEIDDILDMCQTLAQRNLSPLPKGTSICLGVDVSASMDSGVPTARDLATAVAVTLARCVEQSEDVTLDTFAFSEDLIRMHVPTGIGAFKQFREACRALHFSYTDTGLMIAYADVKRKYYDSFVLLTDNQSNGHVYGNTLMVDKALHNYREGMTKLGHPATTRLVSASFQLNSASLSEVGKDPLMFDVVGASADSAKQVIDLASGGLHESSAHTCAARGKLLPVME